MAAWQGAQLQRTAPRSGPLPPGHLFSHKGVFPHITLCMLPLCHTHTHTRVHTVFCRGKISIFPWSRLSEYNLSKNLNSVHRNPQGLGRWACRSQVTYARVHMHDARMSTHCVHTHTPTSRTHAHAHAPPRPHPHRRPEHTGDGVLMCVLAPEARPSVSEAGRGAALVPSARRQSCEDAPGGPGALLGPQSPSHGRRSLPVPRPHAEPECPLGAVALRPRLRHPHSHTAPPPSSHARPRRPGSRGRGPSPPGRLHPPSGIARWTRFLRAPPEASAAPSRLGDHGTRPRGLCGRSSFRRPCPCWGLIAQVRQRFLGSGALQTEVKVKAPSLAGNHGGFRPAALDREETGNGALVLPLSSGGVPGAAARHTAVRVRSEGTGDKGSPTGATVFAQGTHTEFAWHLADMHSGPPRTLYERGKLVAWALAAGRHGMEVGRGRHS